MATRAATPTILLGTLVVGVLDGLDAIIFFGLRNGATPPGIGRAIARGLIGPAAATGGATAALLGLLLHFTVACGIFTTYYLVARRVNLLVRHPVACGIPYGVVAYLLMNFVVIPLSATTRGHPALPVVVNGIAIHMFGVGLPTALIARRGLRS